MVFVVLQLYLLLSLVWLRLFFSNSKSLLILLIFEIVIALLHIMSRGHPLHISLCLSCTCKILLVMWSWWFLRMLLWDTSSWSLIIWILTLGLLLWYFIILSIRYFLLWKFMSRLRILFFLVLLLLLLLSF